MDAISTPLLQIKDLDVEFKVFGGRLKVLNSVNLGLFRGERVGLVGETGSGKTTTMKTIMRVLPIPPGIIPKGEIFFEGNDILKLKSFKLNNYRGKSISMIFQDPTAALNPVFTIGQQIEAVIDYSSHREGHYSGKEKRELAIDAFRDVSLADPERLLNNYPIQLSGGMRQRVCIAMALVTRPKILIADEPGTSLDVTIQDQVLRLLDDLVEKRDTTVILITHSLGVVRERTNRVYVMYAGNIVEVANTKELFANPSHPYTRALLEAIPKLTGGGISTGIPGRMPSYLNPPSGCRFHTRCPYVMKICQEERPLLSSIGKNHSSACFLTSKN